LLKLLKNEGLHMFSYACLLIWSSIVSVLLAPQLVMQFSQIYIDTNHNFLLLH